MNKSSKPHFGQVKIAKKKRVYISLAQQGVGRGHQHIVNKGVEGTAPQPPFRESRREFTYSFINVFKSS